MQRIKIVFLFFAACFWHNKNFSQNNTITDTTFTLKQCVEIAIKNNLVVEQSELTMQNSGINKSQSISNLLPTINANGSQGTNFGKSINPTTYAYINQQQNTGSYALNAGLTLFSGLQLQNAIKQNQYAYDASKMDLQQQKDNITLSVLLDYLQILASQDLLAISRQQADVDLKQVNRLELQNKEGALLLLSNLYDLKGQYAGDLGNIATAVNNYETAKVNLFQLLNIPYKKDIQFERILLDLQAQDTTTGSDNIYKTALSTLPTIKSVDLKIKAYQKAVLVYKGQYYPTLSLYGSLSSNYSNLATTTLFGSVTTSPSNDYVTTPTGQYFVYKESQNATVSKTSFGDQFNNNRYTQVGLSLQIPILNFLRVRNNVKQAKINLKNAEYVANSTRLVLQQSVELAYQNMIAAYGQYKSYIDQVAAYAESFRTTEIRFNEGVINSDVYLIAKNNIDRANTNLSQSKYIYILRTKVLDYYQGKLSW
jgi:outer membrane protein